MYKKVIDLAHRAAWDKLAQTINQARTASIRLLKGSQNGRYQWLSKSNVAPSARGSKNKLHSLVLNLMPIFRDIAAIKQGGF